ncbi:MAG: toxin-antitoxin system YwqK family antitoxin [FCB group bacterium]|nr:toxin-antitoxin system YwqK family antitoxin [FCB group bacterium]
MVNCSVRIPHKEVHPDKKSESSDRVVISTAKLPQYTIERSKYPNGQLEYEASYRNGKLDGTAKHWDEDGNLLSTVEYSNGEIHGKWVLYYPNGQILQVTEYFRGKKNGYERKYHPNGQISSEVQYRMDEKISEIVRWDSKGKLLH